MEMNLQMFAENTQTTAGLSAEMKTYYGMELLENAKPQLVHNQFAATKGLPAGGGKTVEWRKFGAFDKALKPLTEGVTPDGSGISVSYITKELAQYGDYTTVSDMLDLTAIDDVVLEITDRHGSNMGLTLDTVDGCGDCGRRTRGCGRWLPRRRRRGSGSRRRSCRPRWNSR